VLKVVRMSNDEREYWIDISYRCYRKYEFLVDKLALYQSEKIVKKRLQANA